VSVATDALDSRLLRISIGVRGQLKSYEGLDMSASGTKFANANQNECEVKLSNLDRETRDYLLTETSPFNKIRTRKLLRVEAGRVSSGYSLGFEGDITTAVGAQPPDIAITLKAATGDFAKGVIVARSQSGVTPLRNIAARIAQDMGLSLNFQAADKSVSNYTHTGAAAKQVQTLGQLARVNAYVDDSALIVKDWGVPLKNRVREVNLDSGMIGIPEFTETGVKVKLLFDNQTALGGALHITSKLNPAANGLYTVAKLGFELASRDTPFYYIAEATRSAGA
jgi:hypothetical protein